MTCIVALRHEGRVWMGADSSAAGDDQMDLRADLKIFLRDGWLLGAAGSARVRQVMEHGMEMPTAHGDRSLNEDLYLLGEHLRAGLREAGSLDEKDGHEEMDAAALVGWGGNIWHLGGDFAYCRYQLRYAAIGSGAAYALGALHQEYRAHYDEMIGTEWLKGNVPPGVPPWPEMLVTQALTAAAAFCTSVAPPFTILSTPEV